MVSGLCATCDAGDALADEGAYGDVTGITHSNPDARANVHCNTHTNAGCDCCATDGDAERDVHSDA